MVNYMTMIVVNIFEAKAKLSEFIDAIERGERVVICKRNRPVAELRPVAAARTEPRPIGLAKGRVEVPEAFFVPLPEDWTDAFYGNAQARPTRVAERPSPDDEYSRPTRRATRRPK